MKKQFYFSPDIREFLILLTKHKVHYLIVGGEAVIYYGYARLTGDIDLPGLKKEGELMEEGSIFQFGVPPNRLDLISIISGVEFKEAWINRKVVSIPSKSGRIKINYIGLVDLIKNKKTVDRYKDREDLKNLTQLTKGKYKVKKEKKSKT